MWICYWTKDLENPNIDWNENNTFIQNESVIKDLGIFNSPDEFYIKYRQKFNVFKNFIYKNVVRKVMNRNVRKIRKGTK